ncbi:MAG TPA: ZIP family metal transporter [Gaiellaceae bacterium]|nr:ZIP family metal transporter [Gaiellaceae bacterium]
MGAAFGWGVVAASSLVLGMLLGLARSWPSRLIGLVLAFGAGALVSAVSFELFEEGVKVGGAPAVGIGLAAGALVYFALARLVERIGPGGGQSLGGTALALGAFLDGIPEQLVLGLGIAGGQGVSIGLLVAIFVSNLPEAIGSATDMEASGSSKRQIRLLWLVVAGLCALATPLGWLLAEHTGGHFQALINGFAAGALLVMLVDSMIPEATEKSGRVAGLATTLGFAVAAGLSTATA